MSMYLPAHFAESRPEVLQRLVREHPLGLLVTQGPGGIDANSVPFFLDADPAGGAGILRAHVARANPVWREARGDVESLVVFEGAQTYVSPAWYPSKAEHGKVVPTWNYVMVQARGTVRFIDDAAWLRAFVSRLTDHHERERANQPGQPAPWAVTDAPVDYIDSMLRAIVGLEIVVTSIAGKWKVSQNRVPADRDGVVRGLAGIAGSDAVAMAAEVHEPGRGG
ncbi:MAG TPA: FMN-binding negative transcriptional regulator [Caldimonas sp.]|jgi:transcriptional regulator|nr:FMN-binding negative transcriptional regulator [Caldimonas sp.]